MRTVYNVATGEISEHPDEPSSLTNVDLYRIALNETTQQYLKDITSLQSSWLSAAVLDGTTGTTKKSSIVALIASRKTQYLADVASLKTQYPIQA